MHAVNDQLDIFRPLTKWCARVTQVDEIPGAVHRAMGYLRTGRPRPVELEIPWDVLPSSGEVELPEPEVYSKGAPDPARIKEAAELLAHARRPLIWTGGGTMAAEASREVVELAIAINAPVVTTQQAKGIIPEDHPLSLGAYYYGHCPGYRAMARADVILAVGSRLHVVPSVPWAFQPHQVAVHIDADPAELGRNVPTRVAIEADARLGLQALLSELGGSRTKSEWAPGEASAARDEGYRRFKEMAPAQVGIVQALRRELEDDAIVVSGITTIGYWSNLVFPVLRPRSYLTSSYFATLGFAFPTAIGAKIGSPGRQVVALCGDGGFMYGVAELATAVQEGVNVVALVFNNAAFGASLRDQETRFGGRVYGTRLHNPDLPSPRRGLRRHGNQDLAPGGAGRGPEECPGDRGSRRGRGAHPCTGPALPDTAPGDALEPGCPQRPPSPILRPRPPVFLVTAPSACIVK